MAIPFTDFSRAPLLESPWKNAFEDVLKGYKMSQEPAKMREEQSARQLANKLKELDVEHKPKEYELNDQGKSLANALQSKALEHYDERFGLEKRLKQAQINKANRPEQLKGALAQAMQLRNSLNPSSPNYERDLKDVNQYINKLGTSSKGIQVSTTPEGGVEVSIGGQGQLANTLGLPPLPKGQVYLLDENQKPMGIGKPYSEGEKKEESGRAAFNIWQQFITDSQAPYSGKGATRQFESDVQKYSTDEAAKNRIDNLLAADKLLFSTTVKEEATLGGANTNQAYNRITHSLENSEIYPLLKKISKYQLPQGYSKASSDIFNQMVNKGTEAGKNIAAYKPFYFNTQRNAQPEAPQQATFQSRLNANNPKRFKSGFKTEAEFNKYYLSLSQEDRKAFRKQLAEKK